MFIMTAKVNKKKIILALAAVAVLFFSEDGENDILPFLLLLLLWD